MAKTLPSAFGLWHSAKNLNPVVDDVKASQGGEGTEGRRCRAAAGKERPRERDWEERPNEEGWRDARVQAEWGAFRKNPHP